MMRYGSAAACACWRWPERWAASEPPAGCSASTTRPSSSPAAPGGIPPSDRVGGTSAGTVGDRRPTLAPPGPEVALLLVAPARRQDLARSLGPPASRPSLSGHPGGQNGPRHPRRLPPQPPSCRPPSVVLERSRHWSGRASPELPAAPAARPLPVVLASLLNPAQSCSRLAPRRPTCPRGLATNAGPTGPRAAGRCSG
jgi:hypothetical protein